MNKLLVIASALVMSAAVPSLAAAASVNVGGAANGAVSAGAGHTGAVTSNSGAVNLNGSANASGVGAATSLSGKTTTMASTSGSNGPASLGAGSSYDELITSIRGHGDLALTLPPAIHSSHIRIVRLSSLKGYSATTKLGFNSRTSARIRSLDANVAANAALTAKLKASGFTANDVLAVSNSASGNVTVFVNA